MQAWRTSDAPGSIARVITPIPCPEGGEVLVAVLACGVCRTDLHVVDRDLAVHAPHVVPGHQVVGDVVEVGEGVTTLRVGDRVGVAWLRRTCGVCRWCLSDRENLCPEARFTGWDADGGYAEYLTVPADFAYPLPPDVAPERLAPMLCGGIIGSRALDRARLPDHGVLGIYGYGASAHLTAQLARGEGARVVVMSRGEGNRALARELGAEFVGEERDEPPEPLDAAIIFAPAGDLVPVALRATARGGTVVLAGIHMSEIPAMDYDTTLFGERDLRSVTANTRADGRAFLDRALRLGVAASVTTYPFSHADVALADLREGRASGSLCLTFEHPRDFMPVDAREPAAPSMP